MSIWSDDPEWFDEWLEARALEGRFGQEIKATAEAGDFEPWKEWSALDVNGKLGQEATADYCERFVE